MRRIGICCVLSLLLIAAVGRAAPIGPAGSASTAGSSLQIAKLQSGLTARHRAVRAGRRHPSRSHPRPHPRGTHRGTTAPAGAGGGTVLFGDRTIQRTIGRTSPGRADAFPFAASRAGTVSAIHVYVDAHNRAKKLVVAVYSSRSGHPARRVASGTLSSPRAGSWNKVSVTRANVRSSGRYWIAVLGQGGTLYFRDHNTGTCFGETSHKAHLASLPILWASQTRLHACRISAYATGHATTTAGGTTITNGTLAPPGVARSSGWGSDGRRACTVFSRDVECWRGCWECVVGRVAGCGGVSESGELVGDHAVGDHAVVAGGDARGGAGSDGVGAGVRAQRRLEPHGRGFHALPRTDRRTMGSRSRGTSAM